MDSLSLPFFMRDTIRQRIEKRVEAHKKGYRQNIAIMGGSGMGKTPFLANVYSSLGAEEGVIPVYVHAEALDFENLVEKWMGAILWGIFSSQSSKPVAKLETLLDAASQSFPKTTAAMRDLRKQVRREKNAASIRALFALTSTLHKESGKQIVLMIEEFQALELLPATDPFGLLGKEIMIETETLYFLTSSKVNRAEEILNGKLSLLFGNFETIYLEPLGFGEAVEFLNWQLPGCLFSHEQKDFLIRMTDGNPFYLKIIGDGLSAKVRMGNNTPLRAETETAITDQHLVSVLSRELIDHRGRLALTFEKKLDFCRRLVKNGTDYVKVLLALSHGKRKTASIASYIGRRSPETKKILQRLVKEEIISTRGAMYSLEDPLFKFWLCEVFEARTHVFSPHEELIRVGLTEALHRELSLSRELIKMSAGERFQKLLGEFRNDIVFINSKRMKCPQFSDIQSRASEGRAFPIIAKSLKSRWVCQVSMDLATEDHVLELIEEAKRFRRHKPSLVMVAPRGIEHGAKLIAQESKVQIWDLRMFNVFLDLYGLPKMIFLHENHKEKLAASPVKQMQAGSFNHL